MPHLNYFCASAAMSLLILKRDENKLSEKTQFSEFLDSLTRNGMCCPIDAEDWHMCQRRIKRDVRGYKGNNYLLNFLKKFNIIFFYFIYVARKV